MLSVQQLQSHVGPVGSGEELELDDDEDELELLELDEDDDELEELELEDELELEELLLEDDDELDELDELLLLEEEEEELELGDDELDELELDEDELLLLDEADGSAAEARADLPETPNAGTRNLSALRATPASAKT